ncbi:MAG: hypothetical protein ACREXU_10025 [Gammaproteobacteria bacterium]
MNCKICQHAESRVVRTVEAPAGIRRQRRCRQCGHEWQTLEQATGAIERDRAVLAKASELAELVTAR